MPLAYEELRRLARAYVGRERAGHALQPTALVHEAYLRLVDHCRAHRMAKRSGQWARVSLADLVAARPPQDVDLISLATAERDWQEGVRGCMRA